MKDILWLAEISEENKEQVGEKAFGLAELYKLKLPVPEAFVISSEVYEKFKPDVESVLANILDENNLREASAKIRQLFLSLEFPNELKLEISDAYKKLDSSFEDVSRNFEFIRASRDPLFVVVRSSSDYYAPHQQSNFLGIKGLTALLQAIKHCWASLFTAQAIAYRKKQGLKELKISVIVQKMTNSTRSGVIFTSDPATADSGKVLIEAEYGFSKKVNPSRFLFDKTTLGIINSKLKNQMLYYTRDSSGKITRQIMPVHVASLSPLPEEDAKSLINMAKKIEEYFGSPQIIEWAAEGKKLFLLQTYPQGLSNSLISDAQPRENMVLKGLPVFPAQIEGKVSLVNSKEDADNFSEDNILVTDMTNPYLFFAADKAKAIITNGGGFASHAVQLSKELDKPCIIGTENATQVLQNGDEISIDESGFVYKEAAPKGFLSELSPEAGEIQTGEDIKSVDINQVFNKVSELEKQVTELVYKDTGKRRAGEAEDKNYSQLLSDIEWDVREIRKKLQHYLIKD